MRQTKLIAAAFVVSAHLALAPVVAAAAPAGAQVAGPPSCGYPGATWSTSQPAELGVDGPRLQQALDWATTHTSASVAVYRHGCLAGESRLDRITGAIPLDGWSMTKTVTAMLAGRASKLGLLDIDKPIRRLFPEADRAHGKLTPRHMLTMTSGLHRNWIRDLSPQPDRVRDALSLRFDHRPGTHWEYQQSTVTLLAAAIERAVGSDLQEFAQAELFGPVGIAPDQWFWERDRAGHTEGWAHLHMQGQAWARLGQLLLTGGRWQDRRLISKRYHGEMTRPGTVNDAYGFLVWLNRGGARILPAVEGQTRNGPLVPSAPRDTYLMAGNGEQRVYVIPSRDMVIVRLGENGSIEGDTRASVWTGRGGELDNELIRRVMLAVTDVPYRDPGPYGGSDLVLPPPGKGVVGDAQDVEEAVAGVGLGPKAPPRLRGPTARTPPSA